MSKVQITEGTEEKISRMVPWQADSAAYLCLGPDTLGKTLTAKGNTLHSGKLPKVHSHTAACSYYELAEHTLEHTHIRLLSKQQSRSFQLLLQQMQTPTARLSGHGAGKGLTSVSSSIPACWLPSSHPAMCLPTLMSCLLLS